MNYLKKYNLTDEDISEIVESLDPIDYSEILLNEKKVTEILDYFLSIKITNLKNILINKPNLFYESKQSIESAFSKASNLEEIVNLINNDTDAFIEIGL